MEKICNQNKMKNLIEIERLSQEVEKSLKCDISLNNLQLVSKNCIDSSGKTTTQILPDVGLFDRLENEDETCEVYVTFKEDKEGKWNQKSNIDAIFL